MKSASRSLCLILSLAVVACTESFAQVQNPPNLPAGVPDLNGYWVGEGAGQFRVYHVHPKVYSVPNSSDCDQNFYFKGLLDYPKLSGTLSRCTDHRLVNCCDHPKQYDATFEATVNQNPGTGLASIAINGEFVMQYWEITDFPGRGKKAVRIPLNDEKRNFQLLFSRRDTPLTPPTSAPTPTPRDPIVKTAGDTYETIWDHIAYDILNLGHQ